MKALVTVKLSALNKNIIRFKCSGVFHLFFCIHRSFPYLFYIIYKLAVNPHVVRDNYFYGGFIKFFFLQFKLI